MNTLQLHFGKMLICALMISSISCSTDDSLTNDDNNASLELREKINESILDDPNPTTQADGKSNSKSAFALRPFKRYFAGGNLSVHTYNY